MKKILSTFLITLILLIGVTGWSTKNENFNDAEKFKQEYESLNKKSNGEVNYNKVSISKDNPIVYTTPKKIMEKINNGDLFVVYIGTNTSIECRQIVESLLESAKEKNVNTIYYIDINKYDVTDLEKLLQSINNKEEQEMLASSPSVIAISKKKIVERETGLTTEQNQKKYAKNEFNCLFKCLSEESTTCQKNSC